MHILTLGDIKYDTFVALPESGALFQKQGKSEVLCFPSGEKIPVGAFFSQIAGTAPNVAIGLKKLGHSTGVISTVGVNNQGKDAFSFLKEHHIDTFFIKEKKDCELTQAVILNLSGESTQLVSRNDTKHEFPKKLPAADLLHIAEVGNVYIPLFKDILAYQKKKRAHLSINPGMLQIKERSKELFKLLNVCEILFVNTREAAFLTKSPVSSSPKSLLRALRKLSTHTIIMTDGNKGAYGINQNQTFFAPLFPGVRKEATGAGDAFSSGVLAALLHKKSLDVALAWGSVNATSVIGYVGPTAGLLTTSQLTRRLSAEEKYRVQSL